MDRPKRQYLYIKNMASFQDIEIITGEAVNAGLTIRSVRPGSLILSKKAGKEQLRQFSSAIGQRGFTLLSNKRERLIEAMKTEIADWVQQGNHVTCNRNFSGYLSQVLGEDYSYLSSIFSSSEKTTIEKFMMIEKAEKSKELLLEGRLSLREIARQLGYGSTQLLSSQFKKITGLSPSEYKKAAGKGFADMKETEATCRNEAVANPSARV
jgi:AraC-like DNA-binding protein